MIPLLLASSLAFAAPASTERHFRSCGTEPGELTVHVATTTLGELAADLRLDPGVSPDHPVTIVSRGAPVAGSAEARVAATALGYRVKGSGRVKARQAVETDRSLVLLRLEGEPELSGSGRLLRSKGDKTLYGAWSEADIAPALAALAAMDGLPPGPGDTGGVLTSSLSLPYPFGEEGQAPMELFQGDLEALCDQLAAASPFPVLLEEGVDLDLSLMAVGPLQAQDALDVLAMVAPDAGARLELGADLAVLLLEGEVPDESPRWMAMILPAGQSIMGRSTQELLAQQDHLAGLGTMNVAPTRSQAAAITMKLGGEGAGIFGLPMGSSLLGDDSRLEDLEARREARAADRALLTEERRARRDAVLQGQGFTPTEGGMRFPRTAVAGLATTPLQSLSPTYDARTLEAQGFEHSGRRSQLRGLGLGYGDRILSFNGHPLADEADLQALIRALLEEDVVVLEVLRADASEAVAHTLEIEGPPVTLEAPIPAPTWTLDHEAARARAGIALLEDGAGLRVSRQDLVALLEGPLGGQLFVSPDHDAPLRWQGDRLSPAGLSLLVGEDASALFSAGGEPLTNEAEWQHLLGRLLTEDTVHLGVKSRSTTSILRLEITGPPAPAPASGGWGLTLEPPADPPGIVTLAQRCEVTQDYDQLSRLMRIVPHKDAGGEIDGYRLSAIRRGSLLDRLGILNGDILTSADGQPLTGGFTSLQAFIDALDTPGTHEVELVRRNKPTKLSFEVEDGACPD